MNTCTHPHFISSNQWKNFFCRISVYIPDNQELLVVFHQLCYIFTEQREGWIGYDNICLFQQLYTLTTAEIAIAFQRVDAYFLWVGNVVAILVTIIYQIYCLFTLILTEQVHILILVASGDESLQPKKLKVISEVREKVAHPWVITIAQHRLSSEMFPIVSQLVVDVFQLRIKFVLLCLLGSIQIFVSHRLIVSNYQHQLSIADA